jgi:uncharacterized protein (TIGR00255 family)
MIRSMTGYGQGSAECQGFHARVEIRTLNNRFADLKLRLPAELLRREAEIRGRILARVRRGRIEGDLRFDGARSSPALVLNRPLAEAVVAAARELHEEYGARGTLDLAAILQVPGMLQAPEGTDVLGEEEIAAVFRALDVALDALDAERRREGEALRSDLRSRVARMEGLAEELRRLSARVPETLRRKLLDRLRTLAEGVELDPARVAQEAAFLADRADVTEEIVRLEGHLARAAALLSEPDGEPVGKRLDFLLQEVNRETNTVNSKSADLEVSRAVLALKAESEKVREQIQNLE